MICIIFHKGCTALHTLCHKFHNTGHSGNFPVALGAETVALTHQILCGKTRKLTKFLQILKVCMECTESIFFKELFDCNFFPCLIPYSIEIIGIHNIILFVFCHLSVDFIIGNGINEFNNIAHTVVVNLPTEFNLCFNLVAVGYCYITHIVGNTENTKFTAFHNSDCGSHPSADFVLKCFIFPIAGNCLLLQSHTSSNIAVLSVAVCRLIKIHKVHINILPRNVTVILSIYMKKRLFESVKSRNPHFRR